MRAPLILYPLQSSSDRECWKTTPTRPWYHHLTADQAPAPSTAAAMSVTPSSNTDLLTGIISSEVRILLTPTLLKHRHHNIGKGTTLWIDHGYVSHNIWDIAVPQQWKNDPKIRALLDIAVLIDDQHFAIAGPPPRVMVIVEIKMTAPNANVHSISWTPWRMDLQKIGWKNLTSYKST